jgi:hypothetical protein
MPGSEREGYVYLSCVVAANRRLAFEHLPIKSR